MRKIPLWPCTTPLQCLSIVINPCSELWEELQLHGHFLHHHIFLFQGFFKGSLSLSAFQRLLLLLLLWICSCSFCVGSAAIWHCNSHLLTTALPALLVSVALLHSTSLCSLKRTLCVLAINHESSVFIPQTWRPNWSDADSFLLNHHSFSAVYWKFSSFHLPLVGLQSSDQWAKRCP